MRFFFSALLLLEFGLAGADSWADEPSVSPYIDSIRQKMEEQGKRSRPEATPEKPSPYIDSLQEKLPPRTTSLATPENPSPYIDQVKAKNPDRFNQPKEESLTEHEKAKLPPAEPGGAIQAVNEGRSGLQLKRPGQIHWAIGFKVAPTVSRTITGPSSVVANSFETVYGNKWVPDLNAFVEWKPFYSEKFGSLGLIATAGTSFYKGVGRYGITLYDATKTVFSPVSYTNFTFFSIPLSLGAIYHFNLGNYIRPYVQVAPTLIGFVEARNDDNPAPKGHSKGVTTTAGAAFLLDWISRSNSWDLYQDFSIKHFYLNVEYTKLTTISSTVDFSYSGMYAGFSFEF